MNIIDWLTEGEAVDPAYRFYNDMELLGAVAMALGVLVIILLIGVFAMTDDWTEGSKDRKKAKLRTAILVPILVLLVAASITFFCLASPDSNIVKKDESTNSTVLETYVIADSSKVTTGAENGRIQFSYFDEDGTLEFAYLDPSAVTVQVVDDSEVERYEIVNDQTVTATHYQSGRVSKEKEDAASYALYIHLPKD